MIGICSCDLLEPKKEDPNTLNGDVNLDYTKVGYKSNVYIKIDNGSVPNGTMTVQKNENGIVTYKININMAGFKDSAFYANLLGPDNRDNKGNVFVELKMKVTSEGIQDFYNREKPWTVLKYNDGVGTEYPYVKANGEKLIRKITEKTGKDDWPYGMLYIKTSKVESDMPSDDKYAKKIIFRANHKFGLVYVELILINGQSVKMNIM